jgi:cytoskeleton protein RodZ
VKLGNVDAVEVKRAGVAVDLEPFSRANVARFTLSSDGSLAPVAN